jgi:hypothetical protein
MMRVPVRSPVTLHIVRAMSRMASMPATSAVCITGLIVVDTATHFTFWGQLYLLVLIYVLVIR